MAQGITAALYDLCRDDEPRAYVEGPRPCGQRLKGRRIPTAPALRLCRENTPISIRHRVVIKWLPMRPAGQPSRQKGMSEPDGAVC